MIVDYDGRIIAQAESGPGERIVVGPVDLAALRNERATRRGHHMLAHLRNELYGAYSQPIYPRARPIGNWPISIEGNQHAIESARTASPIPSQSKTKCVSGTDK
jgi:hypothetical protein